VSDKKIIKQRLRDISKQASDLLDKEPAVLHISGSTTIVGDIHGRFDMLNYILKNRKDIDNILFLGDYVGRGPRGRGEKQGAECLLKLLEQKIKYPTHFFLLRGNHEDIEMNKKDGFYKEIGSDDQFIKDLHNYIYTKLPIAAIINENAFCVHGGISEETKLDHIKKEDSYQYLWNDPWEKTGMKKSLHGDKKSWKFGPDIVDKFLTVNHLSKIIRGHNHNDKGEGDKGEGWFDKKLLTLISIEGAFVVYKDGAFFLYKDGEIIEF